jgi:hypothetical protein
LVELAGGGLVFRGVVVPLLVMARVVDFHFGFDARSWPRKQPQFERRRNMLERGRA